MPIEVYTGLPGNGKTAFMMDRLIAESKKGERPIVAAGIDGLQPGLATVLDDPKRWNDHDDAGNRIVPDGALIFIDEAWKWFGHLHDATRQATPAHVLALAEHRHRGIDFVWTTQAPNQIYPFARALCAGHHHHVRRFGTHFVDVYTWQELNEDVKSQAKRENAQKATKTLPKAVFGQYKSAESHTIKAKLPLKVLAIPLALPLAAALLWYAWGKLNPTAYAGTLGAEGTQSASADAPPSDGIPPHANGKGPRYATAEAYAKAHVPRIATLPWSAEIFDGRNVTADPQIFCAHAGSGLDANGDHLGESCTCLTEQGTPYKLTDAECKMVATQGHPYNPYKERRRDTGAARTAQGGGKAPTATALHGTVIDGEQMSGYGGFRPGDAESAP